MTLVDNLRENLRGNLRESKAVHTVAGAGDLAVEKLREMPEQMTRVRETATRYQGDVRETVVRLRDNVGRVQDRVEPRDLPGAAVAYAAHAAARTAEIIDGLAERGRKVVQRDERPSEITGRTPGA